MAFEVTIPAIGESITEGILARWLVDDGSWVEEGKPLYELETDKVSSEVAAEVSGQLSISVGEGETVPVGGVIGTIDTDAAAPAAAAEETPAAVPASTEAEPLPTPQDSGEPLSDEASGSDRVSPAARRLIDQHGLDPNAISGSGHRGTITKQDVQNHIAGGGSTAPQPAAPAPAAAAAAPASPPPPAAKPAASPAPAASTPTTGTNRRPMSSLRKRIAQRLVNAQRTAAILSTFNEVDMSNCMALRKRYKEAFAEKHQTGLGFMSFFTVACVKALQAYPDINSSIDGDDIVSSDSVNMGIAVGTEKGLVVPVLRNADQMSFADIERGIREYAKKARDGKLGIDDMSGGTFTITNGGVYGSLLSTPILNPPQSGILGMHGIKERPIAVDGQVVIRPMMYIALSYDHRIVDGAGAVGFLVRVKELIEEPEKLIFDL